MEPKAEQHTATSEATEEIEARVARLLDLALPQTTKAETQDAAIAQYNHVA